MIGEKLLQKSIAQALRAVNKSSFENRKAPDRAHAAGAEIIENFVTETGSSREELLDRLQNMLEDNPERVELLTMVELLKQYE